MAGLGLHMGSASGKPPRHRDLSQFINIPAAYRLRVNPGPCRISKPKPLAKAEATRQFGDPDGTDWGMARGAGGSSSNPFGLGSERRPSGNGRASNLMERGR